MFQQSSASKPPRRPPIVSRSGALPPTVVYCSSLCRPPGPSCKWRCRSRCAYGRHRRAVRTDTQIVVRHEGEPWIAEVHDKASRDSSGVRGTASAHNYNKQTSLQQGMDMIFTHVRVNIRFREACSRRRLRPIILSKTILTRAAPTTPAPNPAPEREGQETDAIAQHGHSVGAHRLALGSAARSPPVAPPLSSHKKKWPHCGQITVGVALRLNSDQQPPQGRAA